MEGNGQSLPAAGWYRDPDGVRDRLRYWDGQQWTQHYHETAAAEDASRRFRSLETIAGVLFALAWMVAVLGEIGVIAAASEAGGVDEPDPAAVAILGTLYIAFTTLMLLAASAFIRLMLSVEDSTRRTAAAVEALRADQRTTQPEPPRV
jgi:hypothetical protein